MVFFMWGFVTWLNHLFIPQLQYIFGIDTIDESLLLFVFFGGYLLMGMPSAYFVSKYGFKVAFIAGLTTIVAGAILFYGSITYLSFSSFLAGFFVIAAGVTLLQVSANTYVVLLSGAQYAPANLCLVQGINSLGITIIPFFGILMLSSGEFDSIIQNAHFLQVPYTYLSIFCFLMAVFLVFVKFHPVSYSRNFLFFKTITDKNVIFAAIAIFFYVGAEFTVAYSLPHLFDSGNQSIPFSSNQALMIFWFLALVGRILGWRYLHATQNSTQLLMLHTVLAIAVSICISATSINLAIILTIALGFFNSIIFPVIFSMGLRFTEETSIPAAGILVTAISGGGIIPLIINALAKNVSYTFLISGISVCYIIVFVYVMYFRRMIQARKV
jgi:FHS family L-fucose permease-like MFS transporter